ncbi:MAG: cytochrome C554 [Planctomycetes bacterium]|nr:cytochrome C554 [Planctomycetota bacterium]
MRLSAGRVAVLTAGLCGATLLVIAAEAEAPKHKYIGVGKCAKLCHKTAKQGNQLGLWEKSKHAEAYKTLLTDAAKETAKKLGIDAPEKSPKCLKCHATAYDVAAEWRAEGFSVEDGVQCESCHGAGDGYKDKETMKDKAKALSLGLVIGDEKTCLGCHNDTAPSWKADRYTTKDGKKVGFDYEQLRTKLAHPRPKGGEGDE